MGSTETQHTPNQPAVPLKPFGRPCKIFVTSCSSASTLQVETPRHRPQETLRPSLAFGLVPLLGLLKSR